MPHSLISKYFPDFSDEQLNSFVQMKNLYIQWNAKVNVVSRKDIGNIVERHFLHSLSITKFFNFPDGSKVLDVGTGGGFPGIPLAVVLSTSQFHLIDSIFKKIKVVQAVADGLALKNVTSQQIKSTVLKGKYDFIVSRAVANLPSFVNQTKHLLKQKGKIVYLKGGDFDDDLNEIGLPYKVFNINEAIDEAFFETKKVVVLG